MGKKQSKEYYVRSEELSWRLLPVLSVFLESQETSLTHRSRDRTTECGGTKESHPDATAGPAIKRVLRILRKVLHAQGSMPSPTEGHDVILTL